jgi:hypothetical protein
MLHVEASKSVVIRNSDCLLDNGKLKMKAGGVWV